MSALIYFLCKSFTGQQYFDLKKYLIFAAQKLLFVPIVEESVGSVVSFDLEDKWVCQSFFEAGEGAFVSV